MRRFLLYSMRIRRLEFRLAEVPIFMLAILLTLNNSSLLSGQAFWEGVLLFFMLMAIGDMANCLADRDLDKIYKPALSEAVYGLGVRNVVAQIAIYCGVSLLLAFHLSWQLDRWLIVVLVALGIPVGIGYSVPPLRFKSRGLLNPISVWLIVFAGPMIFAALLVSACPQPLALASFTAFGLLQTGIIGLNSAEDYFEDKAANDRTAIVALGLQRGIHFYLALFVVGLAGWIGTLCALLKQNAAPTVWHCVLIPLLGAGILIGVRQFQLCAAIRNKPESEAIESVRITAKSVPLWLTVIAWASLPPAYAIFRAHI